jgi:hypothetical protein
MGGINVLYLRHLANIAKIDVYDLRETDTTTEISINMTVNAP